jgi:hypothetical protein
MHSKRTEILSEQRKFIQEEDVFHQFYAEPRSKIANEILPKIDGIHLPHE